MFAKNYVRICVLGMILIFVGASADAQQTVYKWVDKDGVVHTDELGPRIWQKPEAEAESNAYNSR